MDYAGGLVIDCYAGYDRHATKIKQRCLEQMMTVIQTAKRQGRDVIQFLVALFTLSPNDLPAIPSTAPALPEDRFGNLTGTFFLRSDTGRNKTLALDVRRA